MQLATAGVAACIADMITFPLDTTKVMDVLIVIVVAACKTLYALCDIISNQFEKLKSLMHTAKRIE